MIRTIREGDRWSLQTALIHLRHPETGRRVRLMSMIHIGEPKFYTRINEIIAEHDGVVLFEGLGQLSPEEIEGLTADERKVYDSLRPLNDAYRRLAAALDLVAQPDALMQPGANWVRADLPLKRLLAIWVEQRLPLLPAMDAASRALEGAFFKRATRLLLLQEPLILGTFRAVRGWSPAIGRLSRLVVEERNAAAIDVFDGISSDLGNPAGPAPPHGGFSQAGGSPSQSSSGRGESPRYPQAEQGVLFIYGAGHIDGLLDALKQRGYRPVARDWFTAHTERIAFTDLFDAAAGVWRWASARPRDGNGSGSAAPPARRTHPQ